MTQVKMVVSGNEVDVDFNVFMDMVKENLKSTEVNNDISGNNATNVFEGTNPTYPTTFNASFSGNDTEPTDS